MNNEPIQFLRVQTITSQTLKKRSDRFWLGLVVGFALATAAFVVFAKYCLIPS